MAEIDMSIDTYTRLFGVMGERLSDDWAPTINNALFAARQDGAVFLPLRVPREQASDLVSLVGTVFEGVCVAAPYNSLAASLVDARDAAASAMDMIDAIRLSKDGARAGMLLLPEAIGDTLTENWVQCEDARALILGAGYFAACAARALDAAGANVTLAARGEANARALISKIECAGGRHIEYIAAKDAIGPGAGRYDILVNATPLGLRQSEAQTPFTHSLIDSCQAALDCVSNPIESEFLRAAAIAGARAVSGFEVKLRFAELCQKAWGFKPLKRAVRMDVFGQLRRCADNA